MTINIFIRSVYIVLIFFIVGCSSIEKIAVVKDPSYVPSKRKTILTDELACFGDMLSEYRTIKQKQGRVSPLTISIVSVKDATNLSTESSREIPHDMTDLAIGVASNIGGPIRLLHIPTSDEILHAYQAYAMSNIHGSYLGGYRFKHYNNGLLLYGALTEYDRILGNDRSSLNLGAEFGGGEAETDINMSHSSISTLARLTIDFRVVNAPISNVLNHTSSTNTVYLYQNGRDSSFGLSVNGQSIGSAISYTEVDARHAAIRLLIELGLMESLGKYNNLPYWKCLPNKNKEKYIKIADIFGHKTIAQNVFDPELVNKVKMDFEYGQYLEYKSPGFSSSNSRLKYIPRKDEGVSIGFFVMTDGQNKFVKLDRLEFGGNASEKQGCKVLGLKYPNLNLNCKMGKRHTIIGKLKKIERILSLYQKNRPSFKKLKKPIILEKLYNEFVTNGVVNKNASKVGTQMYLALWFNAPIQEGARWLQ